MTDAQGQFTLSTQRSFPIPIEVSFVGFDNRTFNVENNQPKEYQLSRFELAAINLLNNRFRALPSFLRLGRTLTGRLVMNLN